MQLKRHYFVCIFFLKEVVRCHLKHTVEFRVGKRSVNEDVFLLDLTGRRYYHLHF